MYSSSSSDQLKDITKEKIIAQKGHKDVKFNLNDKTAENDKEKSSDIANQEVNKQENTNGNNKKPTKRNSK